MCGIAGFTGSMDENGRAEHVLNSMLTRIRYRGPDEAGIYISEGVGLGSVRLSILDLSTGQQPLCDDTGRYWITFNGEIFNYRELRTDLEKRGCHFRTQSDTEVLLLAYREYGVECLQKLNGQFAFAIWDTHRKNLFMARDRVGIRPLFYTLHDGRLIFGSEIKALFEFPGLPRSLDHEALAQVFTFWTTLSPRTSFKGIKELPPGHYLYFEHGSVTVKRYWSQTFPRNGEAFHGSFEEAGEMLDHLLKDAVRLRLRSDVPVGAYLSGGLDSSVIAQLIKENSPDGLLETFSIGFSDQSFDEGEYQNIMAELLETLHHRTRCSGHDIASYFPKTVWHAEMPLLRTAPVPMLMLSELVRKFNFKVVMTGEGADEMLGGYNIFKEMMVRRFWAQQPQSRLRPLLLKRLYPYLTGLQSMSPAALKLFFGYRLSDVNSVFYSHLLRWNNTAKIRKLMRPGASEETFLERLETELAPELSDWSPLAKAQYLETNIFMSGYLLSSQGDRMAMGNSVEGRYPFLDHRVMDFCNSLPDHFKLSGLKEKVLLKHSFKKRLPAEVVNRSKQAYRAPLSEPFTGEDAPDWVQEMLSAEVCRAADVFDEKAVTLLRSRSTKDKSASEVDQMGLVAVLSTHLLWKHLVSDFRSLKPGETIKAELRNCFMNQTSQT
ncbi:MAG: asparagine synthase (glutamine-hydrolyzing) [Marinilabiliaceae bacterium]